MKNSIIKIGFLLVLVFWVIPDASGQTLEVYLKTAAENNPRVKAAYASFEAALQQAPQVSGLADPSLTIGAFGRMMESDMGAEEASLSLMQTFPWFGTLGAREEAATLMAEAEFQQYLDVREEVFYEVKQAYAQLFSVARTVELQEENLEILNAYKELALSALRSGTSPMVNVVKIDIQLATATTDVEVLKHKQEPLKVAFNLLLNRPTQEEVFIPDSLNLSVSESLLPHEDLEQHPRMQKLEKQMQAYEKQQEVARLQGMPNLGLGIEYTINSKTPSGMPDMNGQDMFMPMLSVSLPIFRKKYKAAKKEAEWMQEAVTQEQISQKNDLTASYELAKYELTTATRLLELYEKQIRSSEQASELLISTFSNAQGNFEEVLEMNQSILLLKMQQVEAQVKGFSAKATIEYLVSNTTGNEQK